MKYRHEWKHEIGCTDLLILRQRLSAVARSDPHTIDGKYKIRSLYFDDVADRILREKIDGISILDMALALTLAFGIGILRSA